MKVREFTKVKGMTIPHVKFVQYKSKQLVKVIVGNDEGEDFNTYEIYELLTTLGCIKHDGTILRGEIAVKIIPFVNGLVKLKQNQPI